MLLRVVLALLSCLLALPLYACEPGKSVVYEASYESLGIPLEFQCEGLRSRTAWDIEVFDNKLFVASGDYDENAGPVHLMQYDFNTGLWSESGVLPDEQAERFLILNDTLVIPGVDPKDDWTLGNYYTYSNNKWNVQRIIPGGIHTFDMAAANDLLFAGIGVVSGEYPIAVSYDGGFTFEQIPLLRDGIAVNTTLPINENGDSSGLIRVYELFTLRDEVYALYFYTTAEGSNKSLYRYDNNAFHYVCDFSSNVRFNRISYEVISAETEFRNRLFFTTGCLYVTDDLQNITEISLGENKVITDLHVIDGSLYCTAVNRTEDGQYRTSVWCNKLGTNNGFKELFYFTFHSPTQCISYHNGTFYFGMGDGRISDYNESNGTILAVKNKFTLSIDNE